MLETVNRYITEDRARREAGFVGTLLRGRRPGLFLLFSAAVHLVFFVVVFKIDKWALDLLVSAGRPVRSGGATFEITDLVRSDPLKQVRRPPEQIERAKLPELRIDPDNPNDSHLVSTSPRATPARGEQERRPQEDESRAAEKGRTEPRPPLSAGPDVSRPPQVAAITLRPPTPLDNNAPPPPARAPESGAPAEGSRDKPAKTGDTPVNAETGLQVAQAQYFAYVRAKIWRVNERIMPRDWIERMLTRKVSADFTVSVARGGRLASATLLKSCGYATLDEIARQAINTASPFEGFPPDAGEAIALTVTVYYTPYR